MAGSLDLTTIRRVIDCNMEDYLRKVSLFRHVRVVCVCVCGFVYMCIAPDMDPFNQSIPTQ